MLVKGQKAPAFSVENEAGKNIILDDYQGKRNIVLYFYPNDFTRLANEFSGFDTVVLGASKDSCESHQGFIKKFKLNIALLSDTSGKLCVDYDVWREKVRAGVTKMAILRSTFIINKAGELVEAYYGVNHEGHAEAILERVKQLHYRP